MHMRKVLVIALREYQAAVRSKAFLASLLILPIMMGGGIVVQHLLRDQVDIREKRFAIVDRSAGEQLWARLEGAVKKRNEQAIFDEKGKQTKPAFALVRVHPSPPDPDAVNEQRYQLSERVKGGEFFGFLEIGPDVDRLPPPGGPPLA